MRSYTATKLEAWIFFSWSPGIGGQRTWLWACTTLTLQEGRVVPSLRQQSLAKHRLWGPRVGPTCQWVRGLVSPHQVPRSPWLQVTRRWQLPGTPTFCVSAKCAVEARENPLVNVWRSCQGNLPGVDGDGRTQGDMSLQCSVLSTTLSITPAGTGEPSTIIIPRTESYTHMCPAKSWVYFLCSRDVRTGHREMGVQWGWLDAVPGHRLC